MCPLGISCLRSFRGPFKNHLLKAPEQAILLCHKSSKWGRPAWLNREFLWELGHKKKIFNLWKQGQASQRDYRAAVCICMEKARKDKAHIELTLANVASDKKKGFFKYVSCKRSSKENIRLIFGEDGHLKNKDEEMAEAFNDFFFCLNFSP